MAGKLSTFSASITIITSMMGAGINFTPSAFESIGYANAGILMIIMTLLTFFTLYAVSYAASKQKNPKNSTYSSIGYEKTYLLGLSVDLSIVLAQFMTGLSFFNYMVDLAVLFVARVSDKEDSRYKQYKLIFMVGIGLVLYLLSLKKDLSSLWFTSYAGVGSVFYLLCLMIFFNFFIGSEVRDGDLKATNNDYYSGVPKIILAMACQINMVKVYSEMESKSTRNILTVSLSSAVVGGVIYSSVGYFGYKVLGNEVIKQDLIKLFCKESSRLNVWLNANHSNLRFLPSIAIVGALIVLMGSFPLQVNPAVSTIVKLVSNERNAEKIRISSVSLFCGSFFLINLYPHLSLDIILSIMGAVLINALSLFFPCLFYFLYSKKNQLTSLFSLVVMGFSISVGCYILYNVITKDFLK